MMSWKDSLNQFGFIPEDRYLPAIRTILAEEVRLERAGATRGDDLALICCVQLFSRGLLDDVLRIWEAKRSGFDLGSYIDVQLLCGAGLDETKHYLANQSFAESGAALSYIVECEQSGDFEEWSHSKQMDEYRRYFGLM